MAEQAQSRQLQLSDQPMDCCFSPGQEHVLAVGLITGQLETWSSEYTSGSAAAPLLRLQAHSDSCRAVQFMPDGALLLSASADRSILAVDVGTGKATARRHDAHGSGITRLLATAEATFAAGEQPGQGASQASIASCRTRSPLTTAGDDDGVVRLWDTRQPGSTATLAAHTDFVSDLALHDRERCLLSVSGDGTLAVHDLRQGKLRARSEEDADDELLSVAIVKGGRKVVAGAQSGVLSLFSWGHFADCSDRMPGHPQSVDALTAFDDDTLISGSSDGALRVLSVLPNKMLGVVGVHSDHPIERLALASDRACLASTSHDSVVMLWDTAYLLEEGSSDAEAAQAAEQEGSQQDGGAAQDGGHAAAATDDALDSEDSDTHKGKGRKRKRKAGSNQEQRQGKSTRSQASRSFFKDLL